MRELEYYATHSKYSDPKQFSYLVDQLPTNISEIANIVHGLVVHKGATEDYYGFKIPDDRNLEPNTRYAEKILEQIISLDNSSLIKNRQPQNRFIGTCRDFAILACSILRHKGIPARLRCGFASYFHPNWYSDHWVCEHYDKNEGRWKLADAELGNEEKNKYKIEFDPIDVPRDKFLVAGLAWTSCINRQYDPNIFGVEGIGIQGFWYIRANLLRDLAALNKVELLPWDYPEYYDKQFDKLEEQTKDDRKLMEQMAKAISTNPINFDQAQQIYSSNSLVQVGSIVKSYIGKEPIEIQLAL